MKNIFIVTLFSLVAGAAQASVECQDYWGNRAVITLLDGKHIKVEFEHKKYSDISSMSYNGSNWYSHYFTGGSKSVQVEKSVFTDGVGQFWYRYPTNPYNHPSKTVTKFTCE